MCNRQFGHFKCFLGHSETFGAYSCCEQPHDFTRVLVQTVAEQGELEVPEIRPIPGLCPQPSIRSFQVFSGSFRNLWGIFVLRTATRLYPSPGSNRYGTERT